MPFSFKLSPEKQAPVTVPNPCLSALAPAQDSPAGSESCNYPCSNCAWQKASAFLGKGVPEHHLAIQSASVCSKDAHHRPLHSSGCSPWPRGDLLAGAGERHPPPPPPSASVGSASWRHTAPSSSTAAQHSSAVSRGPIYDLGVGKTYQRRASS